MKNSGERCLVDFKKLLGTAKIAKSIDPLEIFADLDKESGKEFLRPAQKAVLEDWHKNHRAKKDVIVKLHTGQGKTLIGLLMLQASLNEGNGPALYVCPNNYLVDQIVEQSRSFGIKTVKFEETEPPQSFVNCEAILVSNCNKLFNGKSVFGVRGIRTREKLLIGTLVMDDAHKCLDIIRQSFSIIVRRRNEKGLNPLYQKLWSIFEDSLKRQAAGTCTDIINEAKCILAVPFWTWHDKLDEVLAILSESKNSNELLFVWDLIKDHMSESICVFSGDRLEISPRILPIEQIPSFSEAKRRIFLSATLNEDAFLVKDMGIEPESVVNPLSSGDVQYSGERLIILPSLVDPSLQRGTLISWGAQLAQKHGSFGVVSITPSFNKAEDWKNYGAQVTDVSKLYESIDELKTKVKENVAKNVLVLVNEYDGIDLPDNTCRILFLDSLPSYSSLIDSYLHELVPSSGIMRRQLAQRVEQGMGRAIRGSSDWCIVIVIGTNITSFLSETSKRIYLSNEAQLQIKIAEELIQEMKEEGKRLGPVERLVNQCLMRDGGWKEFYRVRMSELVRDTPKKGNLERALIEREAEMQYKLGQYSKAATIIQKIIDTSDPNDKGWLFQLMATYLYPIDHEESMNKQLKAYSENSNLFRPEKGVSYSKLTTTGTRATRILDWLKTFESHNAAIIEVRKITDKLLVGTDSNTFEQGICDLGIILGFVSERPEKRTGKGPDNLWHIQGKQYWIIESKNLVKESRSFVSKHEIGQLSNAIGWFKKYYETEEGVPIIIHPAKELNDDAFLKEPFWVLTLDNLGSMRDNVINFYTSLASIAFDKLSVDEITQKLQSNNLDTGNLVKGYLQRGNK